MLNLILLDISLEITKVNIAEYLLAQMQYVVGKLYYFQK